MISVIAELIQYTILLYIYTYIYICKNIYSIIVIIDVICIYIYISLRTIVFDTFQYPRVGTACELLPKKGLGEPTLPRHVCGWTKVHIAVFERAWNQVQSVVTRPPPPVEVEPTQRYLPFGS